MWTTSRDLEALTKAGVLRKVGRTGKGTYYTLDGKGLRKGSKGSSSPEDGNGSRRAQTAQPQRKAAPSERGKKGLLYDGVFSSREVVGYLHVR